MKTLKQFIDEKGRCWPGHKPVAGKKAYSPGSCVKEDGMGAAAASAGPTNVVGNGAIAGTGGKGGEPGVSKKRNPIIVNMMKRRKPQ